MTEDRRDRLNPDLGWSSLTGSLSAVVPRLVSAALSAPSYEVDFHRLALVPGWILWLGHPPVPDLSPYELLDAPPELIWDDPATAIITASGVALDYARRRGITKSSEGAALLRREGPVAIVAPEGIHPRLTPLLEDAERLGITVLHGAEELDLRLSRIASFAARRSAHAAPVGRPHDPALSFEEVATVDRIGGNPLSSFVLHNEAEGDEVRVTGTFGPRVAIEVGVRRLGLDLAATAALEATAAAYPGFLSGVTSRLEGHWLEIAWAERGSPSAHEIGEAFRAWLKALDGVSSADVHIAFAPPSGRSALLTDMRARAAAYKELRDAAITVPAGAGRSVAARNEELGVTADTRSRTS